MAVSEDVVAALRPHPRTCSIPLRPSRLHIACITLIAALATVALTGCVSTSETALDDAQAPRKPNIVLILMDDLGYADLGCQGFFTDIQTPNIDSLARGGVRFTSAYATAPVGSPSRAALLTGRYQQRFGHERDTGSLTRVINDNIGLPASELTLADILKAEGYATGIIGKWHLGANDRYHPVNRGFDEFFGHLGAAHWYTVWDDHNWGPIYRGMAAARGDDYLTDAFSREAVSFVQRHHDEPFLLFLAYNAVHAPLQAPKEHLERFSYIADESRRTLAAMLSVADDGIGHLLQALRRSGIERDTLIFFMSDNGGDPGTNASRNDPLRGAKGSLYEGGIRVPFILRWPAAVPAGLVYDEPISTLDVFPTAVAAARVKLPRDRIFDGVNIVPYVTGENENSPRDALYWRWGDHFAMRRGQWKLVKSGRSEPALYDLDADVGERDDLAQNEARLVKKLTAEYARWQQQMAEPLWLAPGQEPPRRNTR